MAEKRDWILLSVDLHEDVRKMSFLL